MAREFKGDPQKIRTQSVEFVKKGLQLQTNRWREAEVGALNKLALVLAIVPGIERWSPDEKQLVARIIQAKASRDEALYLKLMQKHKRLRAGVIRLGS